MGLKVVQEGTTRRKYCKDFLLSGRERNKCPAADKRDGDMWRSDKDVAPSSEAECCLSDNMKREGMWEGGELGKYNRRGV